MESSLSLLSDNSSTTTVDRYDPIYQKICMVYSRAGDTILTKREFQECCEEVTMSKASIEHDGVYQLILGEYYVWEKHQSGDVWCGVVTHQFPVTEFDQWFINLMLSLSKIAYKNTPGNVCNEITDLFAQILKHNVEEDMWESVGKQQFKQNVDFFTTKSQPIEAVLPGFPCKSSNHEKVFSELPDKGEELALRRLIYFAREVKKVYSPGIIIWIVSDGHVFSDCIAVDDLKVNRYSSALRQLYRQISSNGGIEGPSELDDCNKFCSLPEIFNLKASFNCEIVEHVELGHYLDTELDAESELCRKILMNSCDTDNGKLAAEVKTPGHPRLSLYRGFSKFMTEDLQFHPKVGSWTRKKFKKIASQVAFEMIKRNDAYSNLVELMFPFHLRFSIHAHNNAGPKFGISLLRGQCYPINSIQDHRTPIHTDLLHIPTPWHNSVVKINELYYAIKAKKVEDEFAKGSGYGQWDPQNLHYIYFSQ